MAKRKYTPKKGKGKYVAKKKTSKKKTATFSKRQLSDFVSGLRSRHSNLEEDE